MNVREDESDEEYENLAKDESDRFDEVEATEDMEIEDEALFSLPSSNNVKWKKMKEVKSDFEDKIASFVSKCLSSRSTRSSIVLLIAITTQDWIN